LPAAFHLLGALEVIAVTAKRNPDFVSQQRPETVRKPTVSNCRSMLRAADPV
jgi:hypothetical protein